MKSRKTVVLVSGGLTLLGGLGLTAVAANAGDSLPDVAQEVKISGSYTTEEVSISIPTTDAIYNFADCMTSAGFETNVIEGGNGIMGSTAGALNNADKWNETNEKCSDEAGIGQP